ncbi:hypothetical protein AKJ16_DCAP10412 [Drosera capensis]
MSAYSHQMEREYSVRSLSSRGDSGSRVGPGTGSSYQYESGFYMTSFAATIFVSGLVVLGILFVTMVIVLAVMLQSCQAENSAIIDQRLNGLDSEDFCKTFVLHAELNNLQADEYPDGCRKYAIEYTSKGKYLADLNFSISMAENYFNRRSPQNDGLDVVLIDIDVSLPVISRLDDLLKDGFHDSGVKQVTGTRDMLILRLYNMLRAGGWTVLLLTRKAEEQRNITMSYLISRGYKGLSLIIRSDHEMGMNNQEYFSRRREALEREGFRIAGVISSEMDALIGKSVGERVFKLPRTLFVYSIQLGRDANSR